MSKNLYPYKKGEGIQEERYVIKKSDVKLEENISSAAKSISTSYSKGNKDLDSSLFLIISGGEKREKDYFSPIMKNPQHFPRIQLHFISKAKEGLQTNELLVAANKLRDRLNDSMDLDYMDTFFLLSDRDHFYPEILEIKPQCESNGYHLIVNNPCFEIWLYYSH